MLRTFLAFVRLARPPFLIGGFAGFALGALVARFDGHALDPRAYALGQLMVTSFQLMVHFANDYFDCETDELGVPTMWSGGSGVLSRGELAPRAALNAALACAAIGCAVLVMEAFAGETAVVAIGAGIALLSWSYSAPPLRLLARGLGELDTIVVVAVLVPLAGYASFAHGLGAHALIATVPGACATFAMMLSVELPDAQADRATGKRNLVVRWGAARAAAAARGLALGAVVALLVVGTAAFGAPPLALTAVMPAALIALVLPPAKTPLSGIALYATTLGAVLTLVVTAPRFGS